MKINDDIVIFLGQKMRVKCDRKCSKAWGMSNRAFYLTPTGDRCFYGDDALGEAPDNPGTYEGGDAKPASPDDFPNKWCVRECERCAHSAVGAWMNALELKRFAPMEIWEGK